MPAELAICSRLLQGHPLVEAIKLAGEIGYTGMQIFGVPQHLPREVSDETVEQAARALDRQGIEAVNLCTSLGEFATKSDEEAERDLNDLTRYLDLAQALDCDMIQVSPGGPYDPREAREDHWGRAAHYLAECCDQALPCGIGIVVENNQGLTATVNSTLELITRVDRPNLGVNYDPGNLYRMGKHYAIEALERFGDLLWNVQVKDADQSTGEDRRQLLLGEGQVDYQSIIGWLVETEYDGFLSVDCPRQPDEQMTEADLARHEYQALRRLLQAAAT